MKPTNSAGARYLIENAIVDEPKELKWRRSKLSGMVGTIKRRTKLSIFIWVLLLGADVAWEVVAFSDGPDGTLTLSQLVKSMRRAGGVLGTIALTGALAGAAVVLFLHWVLEVI